MRKEWFVYQINGFRMFAELREQLAAEQFETKFFVGISCGQKVFWPQHHIFILTYSPVRNYQLSDLLSHNFDPWIEPRERYYGSTPAKGVEVIHSRSLSLTRSQISSTPSAWNYRLPGYISASSLKFLADAALLKSKITFSNANIEPHKGAGRNPFALTVANALTGFFRLPCLRSQSDDFYYYSTKKARTFKTEHWIYLNTKPSGLSH